MRLIQPFIELFHDARGTVSEAQRSAAEALRLAAPRPAEIGRDIARLHAPWWGFAIYGVAYAMTAMAIVAVFASDALASMLRSVAPSIADNWVLMFWIAAALTAPVSAWPFRKWVQRRRRELVEVACNADIATGQIISATVVYSAPVFPTKAARSRALARGTTQMTIACAGASGGTFRGHLSKHQPWAIAGETVDVLALSNANYAIVLLPTGGSRPLKRVRSERLRDQAADTSLPPARALNSEHA